MQANTTPILPFRSPETADPANIDAEYDVIGAILVDPGAIARIAHKLPPEAFYVHSHRTIYQACLDLYRDGQVVDLMTVCTALTNNKQLDKVGGKRAMAQMFDLCLTSANVEQHADLILEKHFRRCMARAGAEIQEISKDVSRGLSDCLSEAQRSLGRLLELGVSESSVIKLDQVVALNICKTEDAADDKIPKGIPTGFYDLDEMLRGVKPGELIILAGRPSMGKTAGLVNVAVNVAAQGRGVYISSLEMSAEQLGYRIMSADSSIESGRLRDGKVGQHEWPSLGESVTKLAGLPVWIDDSFRQTPETVAANIQRINAENGPGTISLVMVDYIQLMGDRGAGNRVAELGKISRGFKGMAKELGLSVWALSQLSRGVESRNPKRPLMSDLRESGNIEEDADAVILLYREDYYDPDTPDRGLAEWIIGKNRNGPTGTVKLLFEPAFTRFRNLAPRIG
ncbi:replicative DNA helicase [Leptolyngbya sp. PCC 7375]|nr:replicative DNA helicase [Leptolyngbya sp. PCC 7375]